MKWVKLGLYLLLPLGLLAVIVVQFMPGALEADLADVYRGELEVRITEEGVTRVKDRFTVFAPLSGNLSRVALKAGDSVSPGDILAILTPMEPDLLDARRLAQARASVEAAKASHEQALASAQAAQADLDFAVAEEGRVAKVFKTRDVSRESLEAAQTRKRSAEAARDSADFAADAAKFQMELARAALIRTGEGAEFSPIEIRSPIRGRVLRVLRKSEGVVTAGTPLLELGDPASLEVVVDLLSTDAVQVERGMEVKLTRWAGPSAPVLKGQVDRVEPSGFTRLSALGVEEQRVKVWISIRDERKRWERLGDGYRVEVGIVLLARKAVLLIPASALFRNSDGGWSVFAVTEGQAHEVAIRVGARNGARAEVVKGLAEGSQVIAHPDDKIADGVAVKQR